MRRAIVTGATGGIGTATVKRLAEEGYAVALVDLDEERTREAAAALGEGKGLAFAADVRDFARAGEVAEKVVEAWGGIDVLVANAGITRDRLFPRLEEADWDDVLAVNLKGAFNYAKAVTRTMTKQRSGVILSVSSIVGITGNAGQTNYAASKAGLIAFTKSLAKELGGRNVRVVAVAPGFIRTPMTDTLRDDIKRRYLENVPLGRFGEPEDIAELIAFLVSDKASYLTGQVFVADGGMT